MKRYLSKAEIGDEYFFAVPPPSPTVFCIEKDDSPRLTGLLDAMGNDLYSVEEKSYGFIPLRKHDRENP